MNIHYNDSNLYITCIMGNVTPHISGLKFRILSVDYVFICKDIDINIAEIDSGNMLKSLT